MLFAFRTGCGLCQEFSSYQRRQITADGFNDTDRQKQNQKDGADLLKFPPGNFFVQDQANTPCADIAQNGTLPHVGFQQIQGIGQIGGQNLRQDRMDKGREWSAAHGTERPVGRDVRSIRILISELCHDGKGVEGNGKGARECAKAE